MATKTRALRISRTLASLYPPTKRQGSATDREQLANEAGVLTECPRTGLAEWLRMAHAILDGDRTSPQAGTGIDDRSAQPMRITRRL